MGGELFSNILVVCIGNVCRSPMAACIFRDRLRSKDISVSSAGLGALVNQPMDPFAVEILEKHGFPDTTHAARQLTRRLLNEADIVLVMEKKMVEGVLHICPDARGKVFLMGKWQANRDIPDPYRQPRAFFEHTYVLLDEAVNAWIKHLV